MCADDRGPALGIDLPDLLQSVSSCVQAWRAYHAPLFRYTDRAAAQFFVVVEAPRMYNRYKRIDMWRALAALLFAWEIAYMYNIPLEWYVRNPMWD